MADSPVNLSDGLLLAISKTGEMAVQRFTNYGEGLISTYPRAAAVSTTWCAAGPAAQWGPDSDPLPRGHVRRPKAHVEYPRGTTLREDYSTSMYQVIT